MSDIVIRAEGLGKKYLIGHQAGREPYTALRDVLARGARGLVRSAADMLRGRSLVAGDEVEEFWALKDVSFEVKRGEVVGIIGRNGAGKSTLLKILSRITEPSAGRVTIKGRVASLLEVGTGFHPELSGRENIYLNGAILGMTRAEIRKRFDEIVAFAEVERFLDTPVKRYSSGMYVRLAFAVAAHLEPEILLVDEVLAVGDAEFQKKCLGKMGDVAGQGRTVMLVSHNMNAVERLCHSAILLRLGKGARARGGVRDAITAYLSGSASPDASDRWCNTGREFQNQYFVPNWCKITNSDPHRNPGEPFSNCYPMTFSVAGELYSSDPAFNLGIAVYNEIGSLMFWSFFRDTLRTGQSECSKGGDCVFHVHLPARWLNEGAYTVELIGGLHYREWLWAPGGRNPTVRFEILGGLSDSPYWDGRRPGNLAPVLTWSLERPSAKPA